MRRLARTGERERAGCASRRGRGYVWLWGSLRLRGAPALLLLAALAFVAPAVRAGSDVPPEGPPWKTDLLEAQAEALERAKPILCYFTKTYCPHCVKVEAELLSNARLAAVYDDVVWLYDYQDFSKDARDRRAERIAIRFGVTSWPQIFLVDPSTLAILRHTGREVEEFLEAVRTTRVAADATTDAAGRLEQAEARAVRLEERPTKALARAGLDDPDVVVRTRALAFLAKEDPGVVAARATDLLEVPNDPFRFQVLAVLREAADAKAAPALEALVREPANSLNPNVLRIRAVQALATCGGPSAVDVLAPHATSGAWFNGLTGQAVDALAAIAARHPEVADRVDAVLRTAYPVPPEDREGRAYRACVALARRIHAARGLDASLPDPYDAAAREGLTREE